MKSGWKAAERAREGGAAEVEKALEGLVWGPGVGGGRMGGRGVHGGVVWAPLGGAARLAVK